MIFTFITVSSFERERRVKLQLLEGIPKCGTGGNQQLSVDGNRKKRSPPEKKYRPFLSSKFLIAVLIVESSPQVGEIFKAFF
jgi:hypothetical protein